MKNSNYLKEALEGNLMPIMGLTAYHPYDGLEDNRGSLSRYPYHDGVSPQNLNYYIQLGGKLDSMGHYGITLDDLAALLCETDGKGIFEDAVKFMVHEETPRWVNWSDAFYKALNMAKLATTPTEFCKLCYKTKGFLITSLLQGKFIYKLSKTEIQAMRHHGLTRSTIGEQVAFIVKYRKEPVRWMRPVDAWKALDRNIPAGAISHKNNYTKILHPYVFDKAIERLTNEPLIHIEGYEMFENEGGWWIEIKGFDLIQPFEGQVREIGDFTIFKSTKFHAVWNRVEDRHVSSYFAKETCKELMAKLKEAMKATKRKKEEGLRLADAKAAGFCINGTKTFLKNKMPFIFRQIEKYNEWNQVPLDIFETNYIVEDYVWEGYFSYKNSILQ